MTEIFPVSILLSITKMHGFPEFFSVFKAVLKLDKNCVWEGSRRVLVKVVLFQLDGRGHP